MRPRIGVTGSDRGSFIPWVFTWLGIRLAGGKARRVSPSRRADWDELDGFVIGGGADVDPSRYGESLARMLQKEPSAGRRHPLRTLAAILMYLLRKLFSLPKLQGIEPERDALEIECLAEATRRRLPVLGICRGAQLMNVFLGGSLFQSIRDFYVEAPQIRTVLPHKSIEVEPGSRLATILGCSRCKVNSLHNQSVNRLGAGIRVAAREPNGVVQAVEKTDQAFWIGVQWHPEYLLQRREQRALFRALVRAARKLRL